MLLKLLEQLLNFEVDCFRVHPYLLFLKLSQKEKSQITKSVTMKCKCKCKAKSKLINLYFRYLTTKFFIVLSVC